MVIADAFATPGPSWDLVYDLRLILQYPYMRHAFIASAVVAVMTGVVGWFMVLRSQSYAGHTLSVVAFPGAAGAVLIGLSPFLGFFAFCIGGAVAVSWLAPTDRDSPGHSAAIGSVQAFALALGLLFASLSHRFLSSLTTFLFGSFTGISSTDVIALTITSVIAVVAIAIVARPLMFASIDPAVAQASGVPVQRMSVAFLVILGCAVAAASQFTGALLVFALLVAPAAAARQITMRPFAGVVVAIGLGIATAWLGLSAAYFTDYPVGFFITTIGFAAFLAASTWRAAADRMAA